ncbi:hypothetical protein AYY17_06730 [Morganella psychrotolerans]|uniref:Uncharacterized protein n=1 Tax=Morganella psychrotolerans TaxID=368603 RepID=A0A1B8HAB5_9GAMM|nr:hypothetical protein AYY17_06730 [Morganella psychrotolerans]
MNYSFYQLQITPAVKWGMHCTKASDFPSENGTRQRSDKLKTPAQRCAGISEMTDMKMYKNG